MKAVGRQTRSGIAAANRQGFFAEGGGLQQVTGAFFPPGVGAEEELVYTLDDVAALQIPAPPFYAFMAGGIEVVIDISQDPNYGLILMLQDRTIVTLQDWAFAEGRAA